MAMNFIPARNPTPTVADEESTLVRTESTNSLGGEIEANTEKKIKKIPLKKTATKKTTKKAPTSKKQKDKLTKEVNKEYKFNKYTNEPDKQGTIWMKQIPEDIAPRRLSEIPTDPKKNEVEFVYWQLFNGKTSIGYLLHTALGAKYWADAGSIRWLKSAEGAGYMPGNCTFVVKHEKSGFSYGFRMMEEEGEVPMEEEKDGEKTEEEVD